MNSTSRRCSAIHHSDNDEADHDSTSENENEYEYDTGDDSFEGLDHERVDYDCYFEMLLDAGVNVHGSKAHNMHNQRERADTPIIVTSLKYSKPYDSTQPCISEESGLDEPFPDEIDFRPETPPKPLYPPPPPPTYQPGQKRLIYAHHTPNALNTQTIDLASAKDAADYKHQRLAANPKPMLDKNLSRSKKHQTQMNEIKTELQSANKGKIDYSSPSSLSESQTPTDGSMVTPATQDTTLGHYIKHLEQEDSKASKTRVYNTIPLNLTMHPVSPCKNADGYAPNLRTETFSARHDDQNDTLGEAFAKFSINFDTNNLLNVSESLCPLEKSSSLSLQDDREYQHSPTLSERSETTPHPISSTRKNNKLRNARDSVFVMKKQHSTQPTFQQPPIPPPPRKMPPGMLSPAKSSPQLGGLGLFAIDNENFEAQSSCTTSNNNGQSQSASAATASSSENYYWPPTVATKESPVLEQLDVEHKSKPIPFTTNGSPMVSELLQDGTVSDKSSPTTLTPSPHTQRAGDQNEYDIDDWTSKLESKLGINDEFEVSLKSPIEHTKLFSTPLQPLSANTPTAPASTKIESSKTIAGSRYKMSSMTGSTLYGTSPPTRNSAVSLNNNLDFDPDGLELRPSLTVTATAPPPLPFRGGVNSSDENSSLEQDFEDLDEEEINYYRQHHQLKQQTHHRNSQTHYFDPNENGMKRMTFADKFKNTFKRKGALQKDDTVELVAPMDHEHTRRTGLLRRLKTHMKSHEDQ